MSGTWDIKLNLPAPPQVSGESKQIGYKYVSQDGKQVVQARLNGFAFSRLKPYESWKEFRAEAMELWGHYSKIAQPERITRVGLRYINRIEIPLPLDDFADYILTRPEIPKGVPQGISQFFMQLALPVPETQGMVVINQTIEKVPEDAKTLPLIFDIDAYKEGDIAVDSGGLDSLLSSLRELKNQVFFTSLTERAKELFR
jgi:uncharacterized protein (TIGR04255 family)